MSEIASCEIRDGLMLPSVNCFLRCIIQEALVVAVHTEHSHMTGEAEGLHAEENQIPLSNKLKSY